MKLAKQINMEAGVGKAEILNGIKCYTEEEIKYNKAKPSIKKALKLRDKEWIEEIEKTNFHKWNRKECQQITIFSKDWKALKSRMLNRHKQK